MIGRVTARYMLSQPLSHRVFLIDLDSGELEYAATKYLLAYAPRVNHTTANLRDPKEIRAAVSKAAESSSGRIDVLVNNAGITEFCIGSSIRCSDRVGIARAFFTAGNSMMVDTCTTEQLQAYINTNLSAPF